MVSAYPSSASESDRTTSELRRIDLEALHEENRELKELVVQLSKLVIKYVVQQCAH
jgi:hypothetical protein